MVRQEIPIPPPGSLTPNSQYGVKDPTTTQSPIDALTLYQYHQRPYSRGAYGNRPEPS
ncbi:hypothetical protein C8Q78DRAFT_1082108 [Trametes maxima]|nr:hypothetical protein C8Q78DRAFT_1082108 [Trametes maxima]